jgi:DNA-directed RNA polymerase subunit L
MNDSNVTFEIKSNEDSSIAFTVKNVDLSIINSLRRTALSELNNVGFYFNPHEHHEQPCTNVIKNDTPLHNELIMHRMSLIPIHMSKNEIRDWNPDEYEFIIDETNTSGFRKDVTTQHIRVRHITSDTYLNESTVRRWFPFDSYTKDFILITKLNKEESSRFHIKAKAIFGTASKNVSFGVISKFAVEFVIDEELAKKNCKKEFEAQHITNEATSPDGNQTNYENTAEWKNFKKQFDSLDRERCYSKNKFLEPNWFKISIDSECALKPKDIFSDAIETLKTNIIKHIEVAKTSQLEIMNNNSFMTVVIPSSTHTIGNLVQSITYNHAIRSTGMDNQFTKDLRKHKLTYVGYNIPHPLDTILLFKFKGDMIMTNDDAKQCYLDMLDTTLFEINEFQNEWITFLSNINT